MTMLEAIELVRSTPAGEVTAEQLAKLRALLEKMPSLFTVVGGRPAVEAYIAKVEAALQSPRPAKRGAHAQGGPVPGGMQPVSPAKPPPLPFRAVWPRRRLVEIGVFGTLLVVGGGAFIALLLSMTKSSGSSAAAHAASAAGSNAKEGPAHDDASAADGDEKAGHSAGQFVLADEPDDAWQEWRISKGAGAKVEKVLGWDLRDPDNPRPTRRLTTSAGGLTFERQLVMDDGVHSLRIECVQTAASPVGTIEVTIDVKSIGSAKVAAHGGLEPVLIPLTPSAGKQVTLKLVYTPGDPNEQVEWRRMELSSERMEAVTPAGEPDASRVSLRLWLRADRGIKDAAGRGPTDAGFDGYVTTWEDQSTRKFHLTSGGANAPKYSAAEAMLASKPGVALGGGAFLRRQGEPLYASPVSTTFAVFTVRGLARKEYRRSTVVMETSPPTFGWHSGAHHNRRGRYGHDVTFIGPKPAAMTSPLIPMGTYAMIAAARVDGRQSLLEINGGQRTPFDANGENSGDTFILGGGHASPGSYGGTIAELLIFDRALSTVEIRLVGQYLQTRYGIAGGY